MLFVKLKMILLLLLKCGIDAKPPENLPDVRVNMVQLLLSCFADRLETIITTLDLGEIFVDASWDFGPIPMILIDENANLSDGHRPVLHKATFVFVANSTRSFGALLRAVRSSPWWYIDSLLFIVGNPQEECKPAADILKRSWKNNLLSSLYLCYDRDNGTMIYTYNPYTNRAPSPWKEVAGSDRPDNRWTLFARRYLKGRKNCANLSFDKTKFMDGYPIKGVLAAKPGTEWKADTDYNLESLIEKHPSIISAIFFQYVTASMNMTATIRYDHLGYYVDGKAVGYLPKVINGTYDLSMLSSYLQNNLSALYPFVQTGPRILTQQRDFLSPEEKILAFYSTEIWYLTFIVLLISFVFILVIYKKREFALAAFDVLRLLLSASLHVPFNRTATRIFFFCVFQLIIILHATFHGNISAFLTKPERYYVNSVEDLQNYHYNAYAPVNHENVLAKLKEKLQTIHHVTGIDCSQNVVNDPSVACIEYVEFILDLADKHKLHISDSNLFQKYVTFLTRKDWLLKERMDYYTSHFIEAGFFEYWHDHKVNVPLQKLKSRETEETSAQYRPIKLADLAFAFRILGIGLTISICVFISEIIPWQKLLRMMKKMKKRLMKSSIVSKLRWRR